MLADALDLSASLQWIFGLCLSTPGSGLVYPLPIPRLHRSSKDEGGV